VTLIFGPAAFAPIAASSLMIRPINVAMNALTEFERAQMARQIGGGHIDLAMASVRFFRFVLMAAWLATAAGIVALLYCAPRLIFPARYDFSFLVTGAALWMAVAGIRLLRTPDSALLQAAGAFRPLAFASVLSSGISIAAVFALLPVGGPLWSIAGIVFGETVFAGWIWRQARRWRDDASRGPAQPIFMDSAAVGAGSAI
jgi:O-antigen/teichoic acid export membrane protein